MFLPEKSLLKPANAPKINVLSINYSTSIDAVWKKVRKIIEEYKMSHFTVLKMDGATISKPTDTSRIIAKTLGEASKDLNNPTWQCVRSNDERKQPDFSTSLNIFYNAPFIPQEQHIALNLCDNSSAPGEDLIYYHFLSLVHNNALTTLLTIFNFIWYYI